MSKGSKQRPEAIKGSYRDNYDRIFRKPVVKVVGPGIVCVSSEDVGKSQVFQDMLDDYGNKT